MCYKPKIHILKLVCLGYSGITPVLHWLHVKITLSSFCLTKCSMNLNFPSPPHVLGLNILMTLWMPGRRGRLGKKGEDVERQLD